MKTRRMGRTGFRVSLHRSRANVAHIRQSMLDSGHASQGKPFRVFPLRLEVESGNINLTLLK